MDDVRFEFHEVFVDKFAIGVLNVADGDIFGFVAGGDDPIKDLG